MTIKISDMSDCAGEIEALRDLLKHNLRYTYQERYTNAEIVSIAVDELYDKLVGEKKAGQDQANNLSMFPPPAKTKEYTETE